jgi:hypothetical protein
MEERTIPVLEVWLLALTLIGLVAGIFAIIWARTTRAGTRVSWGRRLFICTLLFLGGACLVAAFHRADGLVHLGLSAGSLVICMLWDPAPPGLPDAELLSTAEKT